MHGGAHPSIHLHDVLHHLIVATVLASTILLVEAYTPWLRWLDSLALRVALPTTTNTALVDQSKQPVIMSITDTLYEQAFEQSSPLNRRRMAELLEKLKESQPRVVAIDLDLSPSASDELHATERRQLDQALLALAGQSRLVLATPFRTATLQEKQHLWVRAMCEHGIRFALPTLSSSMNTVVRHDVESPLLANVAHKLALGEPKDPLLTHEVCEWAAEMDSKTFFDATARSHGHNTETIPLKSALLSPINLHQQAVEPEWSAAKGFAIPNLAGKTVFLGGAWADSDQFFSALSEHPYPGVFIHAAAFSTQLNPAINTSHGYALLADMVVGTILGFIFHGIWTKIGRAKPYLLGASKGVRNQMFHTLLWRGVLVIGWLPPILIICLFFGASALLLKLNLWLNPGPLVFGMFIDAIMAAKTSPDGHTEHHKFRLKKLLHSFPDLGWQLPLVGFAISTLFTHGH
ncbi:hypothetical protein TSA66_19335 [Noviherbaspirillum autotrophicum]|uniref:CHASE2 domain-containing protein n=2 Tax=Noviherbaspirillum autotrophicum TaxID=709839 RepID=A0A0C2BWU5_9BURK|nr:hypothetical protein TSA66_19335 [Noviherbaspirillum autotrophicum]